MWLQVLQWKFKYSKSQESEIPAGGPGGCMLVQSLLSFPQHLHSSAPTIMMEHKHDEHRLNPNLMPSCDNHYVRQRRPADLEVAVHLVTCKTLLAAFLWAVSLHALLLPHSEAQQIRKRQRQQKKAYCPAKRCKQPCYKQPDGQLLLDCVTGKFCKGSTCSSLL